MISIKNVSKSYDGKVNAVSNLSLEIKQGEIFGFLGPNGAGKTTTLKMITGILPIDKGEISINGFNIAKNEIKAKKSFGYVSDDPNAFLRLKGIEYLNFMADLYDVPEDERMERITKYAKTFELSDALGSKIQSYSHGMRQKLVLIGAILHNPPVWILDEPLTGLDPRSAFLLKDMMQKQTERGKTVFFSTHVLEVAEKLCDRIAIINKGSVVFCGTMDELKATRDSDSSLEEIFLDITEKQGEIL